MSMTDAYNQNNTNYFKKLKATNETKRSDFIHPYQDRIVWVFKTRPVLNGILE